MTVAVIKYADFDASSQTLPAYFVSKDGLVERGRVLAVDGVPSYPIHGDPLPDDGRTELIGIYPNIICQSFCGGRVLVPLKTQGKNTRADA